MSLSWISPMQRGHDITETWRDPGRECLNARSGRLPPSFTCHRLEHFKDEDWRCICDVTSKKA